MVSLDELRALSDPAPVSLSVGKSATAAHRQTHVVHEKLPFRAPLAVGIAGQHGTVSRAETGLDPEQMGLSRRTTQLGYVEYRPSADDHSSPQSDDDEHGDEDVQSDEMLPRLGRQDGDGRPQACLEAGFGLLAQDKDEQARQEAESAARLWAADERQDRCAAAVAEQKRLYDAAVNVRIRLEPILNTARRVVGSLPSPANGLSEDISEAKSSLEILAANLDTIAQSLVRTEPDTDMDLETEKRNSGVQAFDGWRDDVLDSWALKIETSTFQLSSGRSMAAKPGLANSSRPTAFKAIDTRPSAQIRAILASGKHLERSQKGKRTVAPTDSNKNERTSWNSWHFDDGELYRALLREVIDSGDAPGGGLRYAQLSRSGRVRKKFDRRASKGRKLSYEIHEKLVGFLAPVPRPDPGPVDEIVAGLFGGS